MKRYCLKTKLGECVHTIYDNDLYEAQTKFAFMKKLRKKDLLDIFIVEEGGK